jgi:hypothetical protein
MKIKSGTISTIMIQSFINKINTKYFYGNKADELNTLWTTILKCHDVKSGITKLDSCDFILTSGKRKNQRCLKLKQIGCFCSTHSRPITQCTFIIKSGQRRGKPCDMRCDTGTICKKHSKAKELIKVEPVVTKPVETKPVETKRVETKPVETKPEVVPYIQNKPDFVSRSIILEMFNRNVRHKPIQLLNINDGSEGHWLEARFGVKRNNNNQPDIYGYEIKKDAKKITFGDFSASEYPFSKKKIHIKISMTRDVFIQTFGEPNPLKQGRYSWSGACTPSYMNRGWNTCGQRIMVTESRDIVILYSFSKDQRERKNKFPVEIQQDNITIAYWKHEKISVNIENKFNQCGFFICKKNKDNVYDTIHFGPPFTYNLFLQGFQNGDIFFDSGMYETNNRPYSQFRANNDFWMSMTIKE